MATGKKKSPKSSGKKKKPVIISRPPSGEKNDPGIVVDHKHCFNCGISISPDKDLCSDKCQVEWDRIMRRKKLMTYVPYIGIVLVLAFYFLVMTQG